MRTQTKPYKLLSLVIPLLLLVNIVAPVAAQETMTVQFMIYDENYQPLEYVDVYIYETTGELLYYRIMSSGDYFTLPYGEYYCYPEKAGYASPYPKESNYIGPGQTGIYLFMDSRVGYPVTLRAIDEDTGLLITDVTFKIYRRAPAYPYDPLLPPIRTIYSPTGEEIVTDLPMDFYYVEVVKDGYSQSYPLKETRFANDQHSSTLNIFMGAESEDEPEDGGFLDQCIEGIANLFGVTFDIGKIILGMLLALAIGTATAKHLRGGAQEFGLGMLGGVVLGVLIGLLPIWVMVLLVLIVGLWIGKRYMDGGD